MNFYEVLEHTKAGSCIKKTTAKASFKQNASVKMKFVLSWCCRSPSTLLLFVLEMKLRRKNILIAFNLNLSCLDEKVIIIFSLDDFVLLVQTKCFIMVFTRRP